MSRTVRDAHKGQSRLARYRAERLLRTGFPALRAKVLAVVRSKLRAAGVSLDRAELEACYSQAWHGLYAQVLAGETIESPESWLVLVTFRRAIDEARATLRARPGMGEDVASDEGRASPLEPDLAGALDDRDRLRALFEALRSRLSERECEAASLCYLQGLSRAQAAARMGIGERRMAKLMEGTGGGVPGVAGKVGALLDTIRSGGWCEQQSSLMRAYAFGILDPDGERHALAVAHARACPACRAHVAALRGLASVLPPLPVLLSLGGPGSRPRSLRRPLRRAAARPRPAAGTSGAWLTAGRVAAQVAVSGVLALGGGYALLGSRAHGGGLHRPSRGAASAAKRTGSAAGRLVANRGKHARARARPFPHAGHAAHASAARHLLPLAPASRRLSSQEFSPERAAGGARTLAPARQSEFGIE
jgi:DNA-directed RNA polymerase specialized sigma24 family protein